MEISNHWKFQTKSWKKNCSKIVKKFLFFPLFGKKSFLNRTWGLKKSFLNLDSTLHRHQIFIKYWIHSIIIKSLHLNSKNWEGPQKCPRKCPKLPKNIPNFTSIPRTACWSALFMMSETDAEVGKHKVCTLILRSPFAEV